MSHSQAIATESACLTARQIADLLAVQMWAHVLVADRLDEVRAGPWATRPWHGRPVGIAAGIGPFGGGYPTRARQIGRRTAAGWFRSVGGAATRCHEPIGSVVVGAGMTADIGRPEQQVDVIDGGDIDPESGRSLSVGQLQVALRAAHGKSSQRVPLDPGSDNPRHVDSLRDSNSRSQQVDPRQTDVAWSERATRGIVEDVGAAGPRPSPGRSQEAPERTRTGSSAEGAWCVEYSAPKSGLARSMPAHGDGLASRLP